MIIENINRKVRMRTGTTTPFTKDPSGSPRSSPRAKDNQDASKLINPFTINLKPALSRSKKKVSKS